MTAQVSVVIAVYNGASWMGDAIESVRAQDWGDPEIIVVDDGSSDDSIEIARAHGADHTLRLEENVGAGMARNIGLAIASADLVTVLDADDVMYSGRLRRQSDWLRQHPEFAAVVPDAELHLLPGVEPPSWAGEGADPEGMIGGRVSEAMFRIEALLGHGGYDPALRMAEDFELVGRLELEGAPVGRIEETLGVWRIHGANTTYDTEVMWSWMLRAVRQLRSRTRPEISVIVPVFNAARHLEAAIHSVLEQASADLEVVIVDDGSDDESLAIARRLAERHRHVGAYSQPNAGPGAARNLGWLLAKGRVLAMLDADDLWAPDRLASQLAFLDDHPEVDCVFGAVEEFMSDEALDDPGGRLIVRPTQEAHCPSALLGRRAAMARVGPFPCGTKNADWLEWYGKAIDRGLVMGAVDSTVARRRIHGANHSYVNDTAHRQYFDVLRRSLVRRRASG